MISRRENYLRALEFRYPESIPISVNLPTAVWLRYGEALEEIVLHHPVIFGEREKGSTDYFNVHGSQREGYYRDNWGCLWHNLAGGFEGRVVEHPLADWSALADYQPPDPLAGIDWQQVQEQVEESRRKGLLIFGNPFSENDGRLFDRLQFLRGFENLMIDLATDPPELTQLIDLVLENNRAFYRKWVELGVDIVYFHSDIATQRGLMISPDTFRRYLKPAYAEIFGMCRDAGTHVYYSSDGNMLQIVDDLIDCGVSVHDPQIGACTLEGIARVYKGKLCIKLDLDEQKFPFCKPEDIREQVREVVEALWMPEGGLMIYGEPSPDVPLENIEAICSALEEFRFYRR
jgi:hypothetical protein